MSYEEAIEKIVALYNSSDADNDTLEAVDMATLALHMQIPKKPKIDGQTTMYYVCPVCGSDLLKGFDCYKCHQVIDWSEE